MTSRAALVEQALVDAEIVRAQAELTCAESQGVFDAAGQSLLSSQQALMNATRVVEALRVLATAFPRDE